MIDTKTAPYAATLLRVSLGVMFLAHSLLLKVFIFTVPGTVQFFESLGLPGFSAYLVILAEIVGGLLLILVPAIQYLVRMTRFVVTGSEMEAQEIAAEAPKPGIERLFFADDR